MPRKKLSDFERIRNQQESRLKYELNHADEYIRIGLKLNKIKDAAIINLLQSRKSIYGIPYQATIKLALAAMLPDSIYKNLPDLDDLDGLPFSWFDFLSILPAAAALLAESRRRRLLDNINIFRVFAKLCLDLLINSWYYDVCKIIYQHVGKTYIIYKKSVKLIFFR